MADSKCGFARARTDGNRACAAVQPAARRHSARKARGFTLIELLVVIAIISLLVSILIPSLKRAKELTKRVICSSNLHQIGVALMTYSADHRGNLPEGGRTAAAPYFTDFYSRGWKRSLYPKYVTVPEMCYCPSSGWGPWDGDPPSKWTPWEHGGEWNAIINYVYTPNQATVWEDDQGNKFPKNAEEADSTGVLMADSSVRLDGEVWDVEYSWNHTLGDPQGGNWMGGDGHVEWRNFRHQELRLSHTTQWGEYERWW